MELREVLDKILVQDGRIDGCISAWFGNPMGPLGSQMAVLGC